MGMLHRWAGALLLLMPLAGCILTPGKFTSTLDIRRDRSFTFTYAGEVIATPLGLDGKDEESGDEAAPSETEGAATASLEKISVPDGKAGDKGSDLSSARPESASDRQRMEALAETLAKEHGFRSVRYLGNYHFAVDYAVSGKLTHNFIFPFNMDGEVIVPFLAVELRGPDKVRLKAPGYAAEDSKTAELGSAVSSMGSSKSRAKANELDGTFTLTTDGEIVSQNQENGATTLPDGRKRVVWRATPQTRDAPTASLRLNALP